MKNKYEVRGKTTVIFVRSRRNGPFLEVLIDTEDLEKVCLVPGSWYANFCKGTNSYYVLTNLRRNGNRENVLLHRWILGEPLGYEIDHINHETLDNRRSSNLRVVTSSENKQNRWASKNNKTSSVRGVHQRKRSGKWMAHMTLNGKYYFFGEFDTEEEAARKVREARRNMAPYSPDAMEEV